MDIVNWTVAGLHICEAALLPSPMGDRLYALHVQGTIDCEPVYVELPLALQKFHLESAVDLITGEAQRIGRMDLALQILTYAFGEHIARQCVKDHNYFNKIQF